MTSAFGEIRLAEPADIGQLDTLSSMRFEAWWLDEATVHVAELHGAIVGYVATTDDFFGRPFIASLFVGDLYRRRGAGSALVTVATTERDGERVFTSTNRSNTSMQRLLHRLDWRPCGIVDGIDEGDPELFYYYDPD